MAETSKRLTRRGLLRGLLGGGVVAVAAVASQGDASDTVWQIDPHKCTHCGRCATECTLTPSAVKCVHAYAACGYCDICTGYLAEVRVDNEPAAENEMCPTGAIVRTRVENPYYEYSILEERCVGCAKCVQGCTDYSNGSLYLQILHDRCTNCNDCAIALACPAGAISRVPVSAPYIAKFAPDNPPTAPAAKGGDHA
ncbi:MAG: 4Fe-4S binding protein [Phycisphaerales bacterium]|nr:4Fe-4S binding protein [Phycisphaerales bacterium]